jgi:hypothetical protein
MSCLVNVELQNSHLKEFGFSMAWNELLICDVCGRTLKTKRCLTRHSQAHSSTSKYSCQLYKATFANKGHYEGQINSHNNIKPFKCTCSAEFCFKSALLRHKKSCHDLNPLFQGSCFWLHISMPRKAEKEEFTNVTA